MPTYSLKAILSTFAKSNGTKRTIFNQAPIGGISSKSVILFFLAMPFIEYALIFNPYVFNALGIAQCIILYIVLLSIVMISVFLISWQIKRSVIKKITPSWKNYFDKIDINMLLSSGTTPYSQFFDYYTKALIENKSEEELHHYLLDAFKKMEEENKELIEAMIKDNKFN
ncbi:MAG: hypothetical protein M1300_02985 [Epsilonproteobacteria bacterium]|nr:hypothetical protein [Campylobacterota bacterium]